MPKSKKKQTALKFNIKKLTLQLFPRNDHLYKEILSLGFNPNIQIKFKETKTVTYVIKFLLQRWERVISKLNVKEIRIFPKKINFSFTFSHNGWGIEDNKLTMSQIRKEIVLQKSKMNNHVSNHNVSNHNNGSVLNNNDNNKEDGTCFQMEYDFIYNNSLQLNNCCNVNNTTTNGDNQVMSMTTSSSFGNNSSFNFSLPKVKKETIENNSISSQPTTTIKNVTSFMDVIPFVQQQQLSTTLNNNNLNNNLNNTMIINSTITSTVKKRKKTKQNNKSTDNSPSSLTLQNNNTNLSSSTTALNISELFSNGNTLSNELFFGMTTTNFYNDSSSKHSFLHNFTQQSSRNSTQSLFEMLNSDYNINNSTVINNNGVLGVVNNEKNYSTKSGSSFSSFLMQEHSF
ncbi:hypothetical protein ABK040_004004 [Willaertia magna]